MIAAASLFLFALSQRAGESLLGGRERLWPMGHGRGEIAPSILSAEVWRTGLQFGVTWLVLLIFLALSVAAAGAEPPIVLPVWPDKTVGDFGTIGPERVRDPSD